MTVPCRNCEDRHINCHAVCDKYKDWQVEDKKMKEKITMERIKVGSGDRYRRESIRRALKNKRK